MWNSLLSDLRSMWSDIVLLKGYPASFGQGGLFCNQSCPHTIQLFGIYISSDCLILIKQLKVEHAFTVIQNTKENFLW